MLAQFQQALADLVASPQRCQAVRDGDVRGLDRYQLTAMERTRLVAMANHSRMATNCAMYRSTRSTAIREATVLRDAVAASLSSRPLRRGR